MQFSKELLKGVAEIIVLQTLSEDGESYGYQLTRSIASSSKNIFELQEGTLYPILYRLELHGDITSKKRLAPSKKERRYYAITKKGKKLLASRVSELHVFMKGLHDILPLTTQV